MRGWGHPAGGTTSALRTAPARGLGSRGHPVPVGPSASRKPGRSSPPPPRTQTRQRAAVASRSRIPGFLTCILSQIAQARPAAAPRPRSSLLRRRQPPPCLVFQPDFGPALQGWAGPSQGGSKSCECVSSSRNRRRSCEHARNRTYLPTVGAAKLTYPGAKPGRYFIRPGPRPWDGWDWVGEVPSGLLLQP